MMSSKKLYNWYIALVAAMCMVLYGYDASVFNAAQGSDNWHDWFDLNPKGDAYLIGLVNTAYTIGAIVSGFFFGGPLADYLGRRWGMGIGCFLTIVATFIQAFAPRHNLGAFIAGRVVIGLGQGLALTAGPIYIGERRQLSRLLDRLRSQHLQGAAGQLGLAHRRDLPDPRAVDRHHPFALPAGVATLVDSAPQQH
ncbi:hypothetical protein NUW58_g10077 [Xylaria curta]|uniref:Uncharacterized protein n=1 Tax=Xylaria curta TaxID=42375 RepID=A0ACC1MQW1_9PEZI|nr:hypothetical protein NUW58_g10077 [Xylaria curta]